MGAGASIASAREGKSAGGGRGGASLWKGPSEVSSQVKSLEKRSHPLLTISKKDGSPDTAPAVKTREQTAPPGGRSKTSAGGAPAESTGGGGGGDGTQGAGGPYLPGGGGTGVSAADLRFSWYYQAVWNKIKSAWILPSYGTSRQPREAIVVLKIDKSGRILRVAFEKKSGDPGLDNSVLRAVKKADPLPPLPPGFRENVLELGIRFLPGEDGM